MTCGRIDCQACVIAAIEFSYADASGFKPWQSETGIAMPLSGAWQPPENEPCTPRPVKLLRN